MIISRIYLIHFLFFFIIFCFDFLYVNAQNDEIDFQTWTDFTLSYNTNVKSSIGGDVGIRGLISKNEWNQFYLRPTFQHHINPYLRLAGGLAYFYTTSNTLKNVSEIRLFQEGNLSWPDISVLQFAHRLRLEERFFFYEDNSLFGIINADEFLARVRYQLAAETEDFNILNQKFYFQVAAEYFLTGNKHVEPFINNNRFLIVAGHRISQKMRYELHFIFQRSRVFQSDRLKTSEHIVRLRFFRVSDFNNKKEK